MTWGQNVRRTDPWSAHLASELSQVDWPSTRMAVAELMSDYEVHTIEEQRAVAGSQGDRRRRELEEIFGWRIRKWPDPANPRRSWLYQLVRDGGPPSVYRRGTWGHARDLIQRRRNQQEATVINIRRGRHGN